MKIKIKKILSILLIVQVLLLNLAPIAARAEGEVVTESTPTVESTSTSTSTQAETSVAETSSPSPTQAPLTEEEQEEADDLAALMARRAASEAARQAAREAARLAVLNSLTPTPAQSTGGQTAGHAVGTGSSIDTGDANATGAVLTTANNNLAGSAGVVDGSGSGAQIVSSGNGEDSTNTGAIVFDNDNTTNQDNSATVNTSLNQSATTGDNTNSDNIGGNATTETGDANVTGTIITAVNTSVAGVMVSEFNIADNHTGDIFLDFGAGCISGCGGGPVSVSNTSNADGSTNTGSVDQTNNNTTNQNNDAVIGSELVLTADSGNNTSSDNIGGDATITTGNANVAANVLTFANTNVAGNVIYAVVNIFGDLVGDIIMTEDAINNCCGGTNNVSAANTGNGENSTNTATIDLENNNNYLQTNDAVIDNNLALNAQTGNNSANDNGGGNATIDTGNVDVTATLLNVVNTNLIGGNMWLVLVNEAGNWVGKLMGAPAGSTFAVSEGSDFTIDENGYITVTNSGNGPDSTNTGSVSQTNNNTTTQTNTANVSNNLDLSANTGGNSTNDNIGGNSKIETGDATIIANLVNFVNTNIVGNGKLVVTVVNVFGSWLGDFVTPGSVKQNSPQQETIGQNQTGPNIAGGSTNSQNNNNSSNQNTNSNRSQSSSITGGGVVTGAQQFASQVAGFMSGQGTNSSISVSESSEESKVAGVSTSIQKNLAAAKKKMTINLAWVILVLPLASIAFLGRKFVLRKLVTRKI